MGVIAGEQVTCCGLNNSNSNNKAGRMPVYIPTAGQQLA